MIKKRRATKPTIPARRVSNMAMVAGQETRTKRVIDGGFVKEWVGIGWITLRPAKKSDRYPTVER